MSELNQRKARPSSAQGALRGVSVTAQSGPKISKKINPAFVTLACFGVIAAAGGYLLSESFGELKPQATKSSEKVIASAEPLSFPALDQENSRTESGTSAAETAASEPAPAADRAEKAFSSNGGSTSAVVTEPSSISAPADTAAGSKTKSPQPEATPLVVRLELAVKADSQQTQSQTVDLSPATIAHAQLLNTKPQSVSRPGTIASSQVASLTTSSGDLKPIEDETNPPPPPGAMPLSDAALAEPKPKREQPKAETKTSSKTESAHASPASTQDSYRIGGIFWSAKDPMVVFNDEIVGEGKEIDGVRIKKISPHSITIERNGQEIELHS